MGALFSRYDGRVADKRVVNTWVGHKVGLELIQIDIEGSVKS